MAAGVATPAPSRTLLLPGAGSACGCKSGAVSGSSRVGSSSASVRIHRGRREALTKIVSVVPKTWVRLRAYDRPCRKKR